MVNSVNQKTTTQNQKREIAETLQKFNEFSSMLNKMSGKSGETYTYLLNTRLRSEYKKAANL